MPADVVVFESVTKSYKGIPALNGIGLKIPAGGVFALVGPDGAGKTTLLRLACGLLAPDEGEIRVLGESPGRRSMELRRRLGYMSQRFSLYGDLSIDENLAFSAEIYGITDYRTKRDRLLDMTGLTPFRRRLADRLSGGMRQKLALACTLVHDPQLILMDEPTNGVDPVSRREFWNLLRELGEGGVTLVMSTPALDEAERADRLAFLSGGRLFLQGTPSEVRRGWGRTIQEFFCTDNRAAARILAVRFGTGAVHLFGDRVHLSREGGDSDTSGPLQDLVTAGIEVRRSGVVRPRLEDVFLSVVPGGPDHG